MDCTLLFTTVEEDKAPMQANVTGKFPDWLKGTYLRVGPGCYELGDFNMKYWIDGYSLLSAFHIDGNKVSFHRRYLESDAYKKGKQAKKPLFTEFGTRGYADPSKNMLSRMVSSIVPGDLTDNCNLCAYHFNGHTIAATETCFSRVIDPNSLETKDKIDLNKCAGINVATCHPHITSDGTAYNIGCNFFSGLKYTIYKSAPGKGSGANVLEGTTCLNTISPSWKSCYGYFHSFGMTDNYLILVEQPLLVNSVKLVTSKAKGKSFKECLDWTPEEKVKFIVLEKSTGQRVKMAYIAEPFFFLHHINAYEEDDQLVVDIVTFKSSEVLESFAMENGRSGNFISHDPPIPKRFVLPLPKRVESSGPGNMVTIQNCRATAEKEKDGVVHCTPEMLFEFGEKGGFDLPQINYKRHNGKPYRYIYGTGFLENGLTKNSLCKGDIVTRKTITWNAGDQFCCSEPVFIQSPDCHDEDDGIIVSSVCSFKKDKQDYMVVLDAKTFKELGRASVSVQITPATHGTFIPK